MPHCDSLRIRFKVNISNISGFFKIQKDGEDIQMVPTHFSLEFLPVVSGEGINESNSFKL